MSYSHFLVDSVVLGPIKISSDDLKILLGGLA